MADVIKVLFDTSCELYRLADEHDDQRIHDVCATLDEIYAELDAVRNYVKQKVSHTLCMQTNMRQVCHNCSQYNHCVVYAHYVDAWLKLQAIVWEEDDNGEGLHGEGSSVPNEGDV